MSRKHGILAAILLAAACLTAVPAARTEAAAQKVVTRSVSKTRFEKVKNSSLHGYHVGDSGSSFRPVWFGDYVALCTSVETKVNDTSFFDDAVLQITKDGVSYRNYDLAEFVQKKAKLPDDQDIAFYHIKKVNNCLFITGSYGYEDKNGTVVCQYFFLRAKTDRDLTFYKVGKDLKGDVYTVWGSNPSAFSWNMYLSKGKYVAAADTIPLAKKLKDNTYVEQNYGVYYVSGNLRTWTEKQIKPTRQRPEDRWPTQIFRPLYATPTGMIFMERQVYNDDYGDNWLIYTTNFSSYKAVKGVPAGDGYKPGTESMTWFDLSGSEDGSGAILTRYTYKKGKCSNLEYYRVVGLGSFTRTFTVSGSWKTYIWLSTSDWKKLCCFVQGSGGTLYTGGITGKMTSYTTSLDARKVSFGDFDRDGNLYFVYGSRYLMASKNAGKSVYQIDTGMKKLEGCFLAGGRLVLVNGAGSDVSIPLTQITKVMK